MDMRKIVALNLKRYRLTAGLSQEELAERSGLERGLRNPTVIVLYELATVLGRDPRDLLDPEGSPG